MKTLALVLGNNNYHETAKLTNAVNDATSIADVFKKLQYDVILETDCNTEKYNELLVDFEEKLKEYDVCIFYYAGHGFQIDGENYLTSINAQIDSASKHFLERSSIRLSEIFGILKKSETKVNIIIIDACRKSVDRGNVSGFNNINVPKGTIIAFSTSPNEGASDQGFGGNSIYTGALLKHLGKEFISVEELFKRVRKTVFDLSGGRQISWEHTSLVGDFYFNNGQMIYNVEIPYNEKVVKDSQYQFDGSEISNIVADLKSHNWYKQNSALNKFIKFPANSLTKDDLFIIGRNILQSADGGEWKAVEFIENIENYASLYFQNGEENHLFNGILFEMYFNSLGEFRFDNFKKRHFEKIFSLRKNPKYKKSFEFIQKVLEPYRNHLFYIPYEQDNYIDVNILSKELIVDDEWTKEHIKYQDVEFIKVNDKDILENIYKRNNYCGEIDRGSLENLLSEELFAPKDIINIISNLNFDKFKINSKNDFDF